jgi:hypothetical protein
VDFWEENLSKSFGGTWSFVDGYSLMNALAIFLLSVFITRLCRGGDKAKDWLKDGIIGFFATVCFGIIVFLFYLVVITPTDIYKKQRAEIVLLTNRMDWLSRFSTNFMQMPSPPNSQAQWYLKITRATIHPYSPNETSTPFRITAYVNGLPYGYPSSIVWINQGTSPAESWPLAINKADYRISFNGFLYRGSETPPLMGTNYSIFTINQFPVKTNYDISVVDPQNPIDVATTIHIYYEITTNQ